MKQLYTFFLFYALQFVKSQGTPRILDISGDQIKSIGGTAEFKCLLQYNNRLPVSWSKINQVGEVDVLISTNTVLFVSGNKYNAYLNNDIRVYQLLIADVQEDDSGVYQCQISIDDSRKVTAQTELKVCKTPITAKNVNFLWSPRISQIPAKVVKYIGDSVQLSCSVEHNHNLFPVLWIKNYESKGDSTPIAISVNSHLLIKNDSRLSLIIDTARPNTYILEIKNVEKSDGGFYQCIIPVSDSNRTVAETELVINENEVPKILKVSNATSIRRSFHYQTFDAELFCKVKNIQGYPVLWVKAKAYDNEEKIISYKSMIVSAGDKYEVRFDPSTDTYTLKIKKIEDSDQGTYQCRIDTTASGSISADVQLTVNYYGR